MPISSKWVVDLERGVMTTAFLSWYKE
jgi:hypothetical protein